MIVYFTKQYQAVPALMQLYQGAGGVFVSTRASTVKAIRKVYPNVPVVKLNERLGRFSAGDRVLQQADMIVTGSPNRKLLERYRAKKCMVFHGTYAFMAQEEIDGLQHFDIICVIGPRMQQALQGTGLEQKLRVSGYLPFMEFPQRDAVARAEYLRQLGLDPQRKTLLYLPMGRPHGSWDVLPELLLRQIPREYNLILRPHPSQSVNARINDKLRFLYLSFLCRKRGNALLDLTDCKLSKLYSIADLVISDGASSPEEALFYDLPQVLIETENSSPAALEIKMRANKLPEAYIEKLLTIYHCGKNTTPDNPHVLGVIESALAESEHYRPAREEYFAWAFGDKGMEKQQQLLQFLRHYSN